MGYLEQNLHLPKRDQKVQQSARKQHKHPWHAKKARKHLQRQLVSCMHQCRLQSTHTICQHLLLQ